MAKVIVADGKLRYRKFLTACEILVSDLVWAYLQQEDVSAKMCCGTYHGEIGRVIVLERNGRKEVFQFESMQEARELLEKRTRSWLLDIPRRTGDGLNKKRNSICLEKAWKDF